MEDPKNHSSLVDVIRQVTSDRQSSHMSLSDRVYYHVVHGIVHDKFKLGDRITENVLARELNVSTVPVRDALVRLHQDGWIYRYPYKGAAVSNLIDRNVYNDLVEARQMIEVGAAYRAAQRVTDAELNSLRQALETFGRYPDSDFLERVEMELHFHMLVVELGGSERLRCMFEPMLLQHNIIREKYADRSEEKDLVACHRPIYDALVARDPDAAARAILDHQELMPLSQ